MTALLVLEYATTINIRTIRDIPRPVADNPTDQVADFLADLIFSSSLQFDELILAKIRPDMIKITKKITIATPEFIPILRKIVFALFINSVFKIDFKDIFLFYTKI